MCTSAPKSNATPGRMVPSQQRHQEIEPLGLGIDELADNREKADQARHRDHRKQTSGEARPAFTAGAAVNTLQRRHTVAT